MKSIDDYRKGFMDGMSANHNCPQTLMIMGKTFNEILALICKDEKEKFYQGKQWTAKDISKLKELQKEHSKMTIISMTRKEAEQKLRDAHIPREITGDYSIISILEALGLLHIQEERLTVDIVDSTPVNIKRHGKIVYQD